MKSQWWDILLSHQMSAVIKRVVDDNIICFSATLTQFMHAPRIVYATRIV